MSQRAGFKSASLLQMVLNHQRTLTRTAARALAKSLGLDASQTRYFIHLVDWNQSETPEDRDLHWDQLVKSAPLEDLYLLRNDEVVILHKWYMLALLDMVRLKNFRNDPKWIANKFGKRITPKEAADCMALLQKLGLIRIENGKCIPTDKIIFGGLGTEVSQEVIVNYHVQAIPVGMNVLCRTDFSEREFAAASIAIRKEALSLFKDEIRAFHRRIMELSSKTAEPDAVFQLNIQFFPLTNEDEEAA
jgi:uncharacterized protein (TIGR02147 family)